MRWDGGVPQQSGVWLGTKHRSSHPPAGLRDGGGGGLKQRGTGWGLLVHQPADKLPRQGLTPLQGLFLWGAAQTLPLAPRPTGVGSVVSLSPYAQTGRGPSQHSPWGAPPSRHKPFPRQKHGRAKPANRTASEGLRKPNLPQEI